MGLGLLMLFAYGCSHEPRARNITGPDGSPMVHVSCGGDQSECFELAGRSCPTGYTLFPIFDAHDNNFLVRCEVGAQARSNELLAAPLPAPQPRALTPQPPPSLTAPPANATATAWTSPAEPTAHTGNTLGTDWGY